MIYNKEGPEVEVLQGDRVVNKIAGVNAIIIAKHKDKPNRVILFAIDTKEKFISNVSLLYFVSRGRIPRNSGPKLDINLPVYPDSFRTVHVYDQVVIKASSTVGIVSAVEVRGEALQCVKIITLDGETIYISVFDVSLVKRDNGLLEQLKEVLN